GLREVIDAELAQLPDNYRAVIVLCDLEGQTRKEAARQLGLPEGTVAGRLTRGRALLAERLHRHGLAGSGVAAGAGVSLGLAPPPAPAAAVASTIKAAGLMATGQAVPPGLISAKVVALADGVIKTMFATKIKSVLAVVLVAFLLCGIPGVALLQGPMATA